MTTKPIAPSSAINWEGFTQALGEIEIINDPSQRAKLSQDYHTFSPILVSQLAGKHADCIVRPTTEAEVITVAAACAQFRVPITVRGSGTGNYGQCVPLHGGIVLDMTRLNTVVWIRSGVVRAKAGTKLATIDQEARPLGWELRMVPSTYRTATVGGFIAGGSGGIGSVTYGLLGDLGNVLALRVVTVEEEPRVLELRGEAVQQVNHAWGINGIITEVELPLAPAYPWLEVIATFPEFMAAARFGYALGQADGLVKKLISIHAWPIPRYFTALQAYFPETENQHGALLLIAESALEPVQTLVRDYGGAIALQRPCTEKGPALAEYTWNHTTLHARSTDDTITYLQTLFPADPDLKLVEELYHHFGDEVMMHLEFLRTQGQLIPAALQLVRFSTAERLQEIMAYHETKGAFIANPHTYLIEEGGRKVIDPVQLTFKTHVDPYGLMNPGKMKTAS